MKRIPQNEDDFNIAGATIEAESLPYFQAPNSIVDIEKFFTSYEKLTYLILCRYGNRGRVAFPSYNTIARKGEFSRDTAKRAIKGLIKKGCIIKQNTQSESGGYTSNNYRVIYSLDTLCAVSTQGGGCEHPGLDAVSTSRKKDLKVYKDILRENLSTDLNNKEQALNVAIEHFKQLYQDEYKRQPVICNSNLNTITALLEKHDAELIADCLTLHVKEPDAWTIERASSLGTFEHNLEGYLDKVNKRRLSEEREQMQRLYQQKMEQEQSEKDSQLAREKAEYEALPAIEKARRDLEKYQGMVESLKPLREEAAAQGDKTSVDKLLEYAQKEAELIAIINTLEAEAV